MKKFLISIFLVLITLAVFAQIGKHDYINYDDQEYAFENWHVYNGFSLENLKFAFTKSWSANWHPLTWMSHMLDFELFGARPGLHHLSSLFLHLISTVLLFLVLDRMTGCLWRSALVAAFFALHPLHVESVAWISERKDVLSALFFMLTLWAYEKYVQSRGIIYDAQKGAINRVPAFYILALTFFACGLMSKPMLVTVPVLLLVLDYWPLGRFSRENARRLVLEKIPFLALSLISSALTLWAQKNALVPVEGLSFHARFFNAAISYIAYLKKTFFPLHLSIFYPHPGGGVSLGQAVLCLLLIGFIFLISFYLRKKLPFLLAGWLWYFIMLIPVIGIIQVGVQAMADRYTYLPLIGIFVSVVWLFPDKWIFRAAGVMAVLACAYLSFHQTGRWKTSETIFQDALRNTKNNYYAHFSLGLAYSRQGNLQAAESEFMASLKDKPDFLMSLNALGLLLARQDRIAEAEKFLRYAAEIGPGYYEAHHNLAALLTRQKRNGEAIAALEKVTKLRPEYPPVWYRLANLLAEEKRTEEAVKYYQKALELRPDFIMAHYNLAKSFAQLGKVNEANQHYIKAIRTVPHSAEAHYELAVIFSEQGNPAGAIEHYKKTLEAYPNLAEAHHDLGILYAGQKDWQAAEESFQNVLKIRPNHADAIISLGNIRAEQEKLEEALQFYDQALKADPNHARAHFNRAMILEKKGQIDKAAAHYQEALRANPDYPQARVKLESLQKERGVQ